jgi:transcriptional regulator with XRE-family HTH domain
LVGTWAGNLILLARNERALSQRELARRAETSQAAIAAYESGRRSPSLETLARIVRAAGLDLRIQLAPADDHDEWLARYERSLPRRVVAASRRQDQELVEQARSERLAPAVSPR